MKTNRAVLCIGALGLLSAVGCCMWFWGSFPGGKAPVVQVTPKEQKSFTKNMASGLDPEDINSLESILNVQAAYKTDQESQDQRVCLAADALVTVPDVEVIPTQRVNEKEFSQEWIDTVTKAFFGDAPVYLASAYNQRTINEIREAMEKLEAFSEEGIRDPYHYGTTENGEYLWDVEKMIKGLSEELETAPENREKIPVRPGFAEAGEEDEEKAKEAQDEDAAQDDENIDGNLFSGVVELSDGGKYQYDLDRIMGHMSIRIKRLYESQDPIQPSDDYWMITRPQDVEVKGTLVDEAPVVEPFRRETYAGISMGQAQQQATEKVNALGLTDLRVGGWEFRLQAGLEDTKDNPKGAWMFHFVRRVNDVPITYTNVLGGVTPDVVNETQDFPWGYETVDILVSKDGIEEASIYNLYELGEMINDNSALLDYGQIIEIFEKNYFASEFVNLHSQTLHLTEVKLGYGRVYDPNYPNTGELVPVWDFFGWVESADQWEGQLYNYVRDNPYSSQMTINAITGGVIDRNLGY